MCLSVQDFAAGGLEERSWDGWSSGAGASGYGRQVRVCIPRAWLKCWVYLPGA